MKKYIFTETQLKKLMDTVLNEEVSGNGGKFYFAHDNSTTDFEGFIGKDGNLYVYTEMFDTWKVGPISKVPYTGQVYVEIVKKNGKEQVFVTGGKSNTRGMLELSPNFTVEKSNYKSIPR